jgi:signal peptidase I
MKKFWIYLGIIAGALVVIWTICVLTGMLVLYKIPTTGNDPTIKFGQRLLSSNLVSPAKLDFVVYEQTNPKYDRGHWMQRFCADEGDTVQIIAGDLYVNHELVDDDLVLNHDYMVSFKTSRELIKAEIIEKEELWRNGTDSIRVTLSSLEISAEIEAVQLNSTEMDTAIMKQYGKPWSVDNFGPLIIPANHIFALGDKRNNSIDSRFIGCISHDKILGCVIW